MINLDIIVEAYIQDREFSQKRQAVAEKRKATLAYYNTAVHQFVNGTYGLDEFRSALKTLYQDTSWSAHGTFLMELNKLAKYHVPVNPDVEVKFRFILHNLNARNVGQRIEQFYYLLTQEKKRLETYGISDSKIVSPGNSALIISLIAFWLDSIEAPYICYPSLRVGLDILLTANLLSIPAKSQISKYFDIKSQNDYQTVIHVIDILAIDQPKLTSGEYWAENFFLWIKDSRWNKDVHHRRSRQRSAFPYTPLPSNASNFAIDCITDLGFDKTAIVEDYQFSTTQNDYIRLNALVFAHPSRRDLNAYASITMLHAVNGHDDSELVTRLAETSAPIHLIHHENGFALWASDIQADKNKKKHVRPIQIKEFIPYDRLKDVMHDYVDDLKPPHVIEVKQGRDTFKHSQFQDVNLISLSSWAEDIRKKPLVKRFEQAVTTLQHHPLQLSRNNVTMIVTQLFGLLILADTGSLGEDIRIYRSFFSLNEMVARAHKKYPHFFDSDFLLHRYPDATERAYYVLQDIRYAGFTLDMLFDLYMTEYTPKDHIKSENYDIPLFLARRILDNIPLEYLRPQERIVADFACGRGSFLIASQERLSALSDSDEVSLQQCIYGNDHDTFFVQLARFGLMYTTTKDDWRVDHKDIFQQSDTQGTLASVIIGNSLSIGGNKKEKIYAEEDASNKNSGEKEKRFLEYVIQQLKPGGYLALILPLSFVSSQHGSATRKNLIEECDLLELWEIPRELLQGVAVEVLIIFAQKKLHANHDQSLISCVRTQTLQPATIDDFKNSGTFTASTLVTNQSPWHNTTWRSESDETIDCVFDYTTILPKPLWHTIEQHCYKLHDYTDNAAEFIKSLRISNSTSSFQETKILLQYRQDEQWGKRVKSTLTPKKNHTLDVAYLIDPSHTLWNWELNMTKEGLEVILEWDVSNAWMIEHTKSSDVIMHSIQNIPIPRELSDQDCQILTNAALTMKEATQTMHSISPAVSQAQNDIDAILRKAYHLDDFTFRRLRQVMRWQDRSYTTLNVQPDLRKANWFTGGVVEGIVASTNKNSLLGRWFRRPPNCADCSINAWLDVTSQSHFLTKFPREFRRRGKIDPENIDWAYFHPQPYMYMNEEELLTGISQYFVRPPQ